MNEVSDSKSPLLASQSSDTNASNNGIRSHRGEGVSPFEKFYKGGLEALKAGDAEKAAKKFEQAAIADPEKWCAAAIEIGRTSDPNLALGCLSELLRINKTAQIQSATWCAIGNVYSNAGDRSEAMDCFKQSWDILPHPGSASNRALIHLWNEEVDDAERWIKRSLDMNPWLPEVQFVQAMITLVGRGNYVDGFKQYECRWRSKDTGLLKIPSPKPEWPGQSVPKGKLLVYGEQGMGDTILCLRYAKLLKELGLTQIWVVQPPVKTLAESMGIIDAVKVPGEQFTDFDFHIPALSLPRCFGTSLETIPPAGYLRVEPVMRWPGFNIGICWGGSSVNRNNPIRSASLVNWKPLLDLASDNVSFSSLQVDGQEQALPYSQIKLTRPKNWVDTAQLVAGMDLVVSVDTALVHLCGAMGIPCWVPLHCRPYFVYPIVREDCPWYPSVKLFKQKKEHEWKTVFENIAAELAKLVGSTKS